MSAAAAAATDVMLPALRGALRRAAGSFSSVRARPVTGSHLLRIDGCELVHRMVHGSNNPIMSGKFRVGGLDCSLAYYPNGLGGGLFDKHSRRFVGVCLHVEEKSSGGIPTPAACQVSIVDRAGAPAFSRLIEPSDLVRGEIYYEKRFGRMGDFVDKEELMKWVEEHVDDDRLHVRCDVVALPMNTESRVGSCLKDFWSGRLR